MIRRLLAALLITFCSTAIAQDFPSKPVRLALGYPPGGPADFTARLVAAGLQKLWGQSVIVENRPGASAMIAADFVARAAPDGYTLLLGTIQSHAMNPASIKKMLYDPIEHFTPISQVTRANWVLAAHPGLNAGSLEELIALAKAQPGELNYGSSGTGGVSHLAFEMFAAPLELRMTHVPYKGTAQAVTDVIEGRVHLVIGDLPTLTPHFKAGRLKPIAMTGATRSPLLPGAPSIAEAVPEFDVQPWQGLFGPAGMSPALARKISADLAAALRTPDLREKLQTAGVEPASSSPEEFTGYVKREVARWTRAARGAGIQPE